MNRGSSGVLSGSSYKKRGAGILCFFSENFFVLRFCLFLERHALHGLYGLHQKCCILSQVLSYLAIIRDFIVIPSYILSYKLETPQLYGGAGIHFSGKTLDFTTRAVYWPLFWNRLNIGAGLTYHFLAYDTIFFEQDMLAGLFFRFKYRCFTASADMNYFRKWTRIYAVQKYIPWLTNNSIAVNVQWNWFLINHLDLYFGISSYSPYEYLLFFAPDFMTGADWHFTHGITAGAEFTVRYIDMMTLSAYLDSVELRLFTRWEFK